MARVPRIWLHGFENYLRGPGGNVGIEQRNAPATLHVCAYAYLTNEVLVSSWCIACICICPSELAGWEQSQRLRFAGLQPTRLLGLWTLAPQDTNDTISMVSECRDVQRGNVRSGVRYQHCRMAPAKHLQIHATKYEAPGPLRYTIQFRSKNRGYLN